MSDILTKTFLAIETVLYVARNSIASPVRSGEICEYQGVSLRYLEQLLQKLVRGGILRSVRGPRGGYVLARDRRRINLKDIYNSIHLEEENYANTNSKLRESIIFPLKKNLKKQILCYLVKTTIEDLCKKADSEKIPNERQSSPDFII